MVLVERERGHGPCILVRPLQGRYAVWLRLPRALQGEEERQGVAGAELRAEAAGGEADPECALICALRNRIGEKSSDFFVGAPGALEIQTGSNPAPPGTDTVSAAAERAIRCVYPELRVLPAAQDPSTQMRQVMIDVHNTHRGTQSTGSNRRGPRIVRGVSCLG